MRLCWVAAAVTVLLLLSLPLSSAKTATVFDALSIVLLFPLLSSHAFLLRPMYHASTNIARLAVLSPFSALIWSSWSCSTDRLLPRAITSCLSLFLSVSVSVLFLALDRASVLVI